MYTRKSPEQCRRDYIHAFVRALSRQDGCNKELIRINMRQFGRPIFDYDPQGIDDFFRKRFSVQSGYEGFVEFTVYYIRYVR